jgi:hypothetical protein
LRVFLLRFDRLAFPAASHDTKLQVTSSKFKVR